VRVKIEFRKPVTLRGKLKSNPTNYFTFSPLEVSKKSNLLNLVVVVQQIPKTTTSNDLPSVYGTS
jgi:hypothetical protein